MQKYRREGKTQGNKPQKIRQKTIQEFSFLKSINIEHVVTFVGFGLKKHLFMFTLYNDFT